MSALEPEVAWQPYIKDLLIKLIEHLTLSASSMVPPPPPLKPLCLTQTLPLIPLKLPLLHQLSRRFPQQEGIPGA